MSQSSSTRGRKRRRQSSSAGSSSPPLLPSDSINPLSHPPATLRQLAAAGLAETEPLPSTTVPSFPHGPLSRDRDSASEASGASDAEDRDEEEEEDEEREEAPERGGEGVGNDDDDRTNTTQQRRRRRAAGDRSRGWRRERRLHERAVGPVAAILRRSLEEGNVGRAKAAFARLVRSTAHGKRVDLRHYGYWAMGAEILMRDGEGDDQIILRRWGSAANIAKVKAYFEDLIQLHPHHRSRPRSISALHFWPAMLSCEMYNIYIEHKLGLERLEPGAGELGEMELDGGDPDYLDSENYRKTEEEESVESVEEEGNHDRHDRRLQGGLRDAKDKLRLQALEGMRDIVHRMDSVMENAPYSTSIEMLRLRAVAALYMGDLAIVPRPRRAEEEAEGKARRKEEADRAATMLERLLSRGGAMEPWFRHLIDADNTEEEENRGRQSTPVLMHSSLPIRTP